MLPSFITYGVTKDEAARFGLPCGGTLRLLQEPLIDTTWLEPLLDRITRHELVTRSITLATGHVSLTPAVRGQTLVFDEQTLSIPLGPQWRLLLVGAGQLSQAVAQMALMLDFEVLVCDPREEYAQTLMAALPGVRAVPGMPDDAVRDMQPDAHTAIVALTHDPKLDDMALLEALQSNAFYVGPWALGATRQHAKSVLATHFDLKTRELDRLHGPVGLNLGAKTPAEIAVSVVAEIVQAKCQSTDIQPISVTILTACRFAVSLNLRWQLKTWGRAVVQRLCSAHHVCIYQEESTSREVGNGSNGHCAPDGPGGAQSIQERNAVPIHPRHLLVDGGDRQYVQVQSHARG